MLSSKILAMLGAFVLMSAIGFGPTALLTSSHYKRRLLVSFALSSAVGMIIIAFPLYILFLLGTPIRLSAFPVTIAGIVFSILCIGFDWRARPSSYRSALSGISRWKLLAIIATWIGVLFLLLLPPIVGGEAFQYYQTNTYDATNYVSMAIFGRDFPASYVANPAHYQEIIQHNPTLSTAMLDIGNIRPSVSHLLAWQSLVFHQTPLTLYFFDKLLSLLITAGVAAALGYQLGLRWWQQLALICVSSIGFWAIYVVDIDALSQLYAIPLSLLLIFTFVQFEHENRMLFFSRHRWFLALGIAALFCFYPEICLPFFPALALYYGLDFLWKPSRSALKTIALHSLTVIQAVLLLNIILPRMLDFALRVSRLVIDDQSSKSLAPGFFYWLFFDHAALINSLWGLYYFNPNETGTILVQAPQATFILIMFIVMSTIIGAGILKNLTSGLVRPETRLLAVLVTVFWGGGLLLHIMGDDWIAGKMLAMGAPFVVVAVFVFFKDYFSYPTILSQLLKIGLVVWITTQLVTLPLQTLAITQSLSIPFTVAVFQSAFPNVILPIVDRLRQEPLNQIGLDIADPKPPIVYTFALALTDLSTVTFSDGIPPYYDVVTTQPERWMTTDSAPDHLVVADKRDYLKPLGLGQNLITVPAKSLWNTLSTVTAYAVKPEEYDEALYRSDILNPDIPAAPVIRGMDAIFLPKMGGPFVRWMTNDSSELHFVSSSIQRLGVYMESSATYDGKLSLDFNDAPAGQFLMKNSVQTQSNGICVSTKAGSNILKFTHQDPNSSDINKILIHKFLFAPIDVLDVGALIDTRQIGKGWEAQENWGEETIRWATQDAELQLVTCDLAGKTLHFRAFVPPQVGSQNITVQINGIEVGTIGMQTGWEEYSLMIPDGILRASDLQSIEIRHTKAFVPTNDTRSVSAAYDRFWFSSVK